jgi:hypothetical protein
MDSEYICGVTVEDMNAWLETEYPDDDLAADEDLCQRIAKVVGSDDDLFNLVVQKAGETIGTWVEEKKREAGRKKTVVYIPDNEYGLKVGGRTTNDLASLLREYQDNPEAIQFIADMMEE